MSSAAASARLRLGMVGMSPGNGHPYSWSAILNGYEAEALSRCPFPAIPGYLLDSPPDAKLDPDAEVTHVWCQDPADARAVAAAARIGAVVPRPEDLIGRVDAVLLARDDARNHRALAAPFLAAGLPVFIDKPLALDVAEARAILGLQRRPGQVFSCSGLRFAREFRPTEDLSRRVGRILRFEGESVKDWDRYAIHVIDPLLALLGFPPPPIRRERFVRGAATECRLEWADGVRGVVRTTGDAEGGISIRLEGERGGAELVFADTLYAFSQSLRAFLAAVRDPGRAIPEAQMLAAIQVLEMGGKP